MHKNAHLNNDKDYLLALQLQLESSQDSEEEDREFDKKSIIKHEQTNLVNPDYELIDPHPDIRALFQDFDKKYFYSRLGSCVVEWSKRMTICAGIFYLREGGIIRLSEPLLKLRPRSDLIQTLLHEMIHAYLYLTRNFKDRDGHGDEFKSHMNRINKAAGTSITIYHSFHDEVNYQRQHIWRCTGPCREMKPFFGYVRRSMNRAPGKNDTWWASHKAKCNGTFEKIAEPDSYKEKKQKRKSDDDHQISTQKKIIKKENISADFVKTLDSFFTQKHTSNLIKLSQPSTQSSGRQNLNKTAVNIDTLMKLNKNSPKKNTQKNDSNNNNNDDDIQLIESFVNKQVECPMCGQKFLESVINSHVNSHF